MENSGERDRPQAPGYAWITLAAISALLVINMIGLAVAPGYTERFELETGARWSEFSRGYPGVARSLRSVEGLFYVAFAGMALFALGVSFFSFRRAHRWSWYFMWILPAALLLMALILGEFQGWGISTAYGVLGTVAALVILLPFRAFFRKPNQL